MSSYRIAQLSDLHFTSWDWSLSQFFSKRWLGNLNFLFGRRKHFDHTRLSALPLLLKSLNVSTVLMTGDLSTTSAPSELMAARRYADALEKQGLGVFCIPGNHDHYTQEAYLGRHFYDYFASSWDQRLPYSLSVEGVTAKKLCSGWWIIGLDTALATSWFHSTGYFQPKTEQALKEVLQSLPTEDQVLLINHFPFFQHESPRKQLVRGLALQQLIEKNPQIKLYCHGHTHRRCQADLRLSQLPIILDAGSTSHRKQGGWHLIELSSKVVSVEFYEWNQNTWVSASKATYDMV